MWQKASSAFLLAAIMGCGGGADSDHPDFHVKSTTPPSSALKVELSSAPTATLSSDLPLSAPVSEIFSVSCESGPVKGVVEYVSESKTLTFIPQTPFQADEICSARISGTLEDGTGRILGEDYAWEFRTRPRQWWPEMTLSQPEIRDFATAVDGNGNAVVSWDTGLNLLVSVYRERASGWSIPKEILNTNTTPLNQHEMAFLSDGNILAIMNMVTMQSPEFSLYFSRYDASSGDWSPPEPLESLPGNASDFQLKTDRNGNVWLIWTQHYFDVQVYACRFDLEKGVWSTPFLLSIGSQAHLTGEASLSPLGDILVPWWSLDAIYVSRYRSDRDAFDAPQPLTTAGEITTFPQVGFIGEEAYAIKARFDQGNREYYRIWHDGTSNTWGNPEILTSPLPASDSIDFFSDPNGTLFLIHWDSMLDLQLVSRMDPGSSTWDIPRDWGQGYSYQIAFDLRGNAQAMIKLGDWWSGQFYALPFSRKNLTWGSTVPLQQVGATALLTNHQLKLGANGQGIAVWQEPKGLIVRRYE